MFNSFAHFCDSVLYCLTLFIFQLCANNTGVTFQGEEKDYNVIIQEIHIIRNKHLFNVWDKEDFYLVINLVEVIYRLGEVSLQIIPN